MTVQRAKHLREPVYQVVITDLRADYLLNGMRVIPGYHRYQSCNGHQKHQTEKIVVGKKYRERAVV
jgi:hypothetical protein